MLAGGQTKQANLPIAGKTYTGLVTKLLDNFGFIDDSIFFPLSAIKGANLKLGDKVYYECTYKKNLPFNWNATVVQLAPPNAPLNQAGGGSAGNVSSVGGGSANPGGVGGGGIPPQQPQQQPHQYQPQQSNPGGYQQQQQYPPQQNPNNQPGFYQQQQPQQQQRPQFQSTYDPRAGPQQQQQSGYVGGHHQQPPGPPGPPQQQQPSYGQISYTSTPGSAFISTPQPFQGQPNNGSNPQGGPPPHQQQPSGGRDPRAPSGRWDHPTPPPPPPPQQQQRGGNEDRFGGGGSGGDPRGPPPRPHAYDGRGPGPFDHLQGNRFEGPPPPHHRGYEGGRSDGPPPSRGYDAGGNGRFDQGPPNRFDGPPGGGRFDGRFEGPPPHGRFEGPHGGRFDGPPHDGRFDGPPPPQHQMSRFEMERGSGNFGGSGQPNIPPQQQKQQNSRGGGGGGPPGEHMRPQFDRGGNGASEASIGPPPPPAQYRPGVGQQGPKPNPPPQSSNSSGRGMVDEFGRDIPPGAGGGGGNRASVENFRGGSRDKDDHGGGGKDRGGNRGGRDRGRNQNHQNSRSANSRDNRETSTTSNSSSTNANAQRDSNASRGGSGNKQQNSKRSISPASVSSNSGPRKDRGPSYERGGGGSSSQARSRLRAYDPTNLPTSSLIRSRFSASELRNRIHGNVHVPSDLKEVLCNVDNCSGELDLRDIPKPLFYRVTNVPRSGSTPSLTTAGKGSTDKEKTADKDKSKEGKEKEKPAEKDAKTAPKTAEEEKKGETEKKPEDKSTEEEGDKTAAESSKETGKIPEDTSTTEKTSTTKGEDIEIKNEDQEEIIEEPKVTVDVTVKLEEDAAEQTSAASVDNSSTKPISSSGGDGEESGTPAPAPTTTIEAVVPSSGETVETVSSGTSTDAPSLVIDETPAENMEIEAEEHRKGNEENDKDEEAMDEDMDASSVILDAPIEVDVPLDEVKKSTTSASGTASALKSSSSTPANNHRYNVKVILLSTPTIAEMAEKIFGSDFDGGGGGGGGFGRQGGSKNLHLHKQLAALVYRNAESGYSLLGGKWIPEKDGFMPGSDPKAIENPNLIAAAIRLVYEQTGLNLSSCRQWKVFATFVYNRDTNFDPRAASYEITKVYMPDVWTATESIYAPLGVAAEDAKAADKESKEDIKAESSKTSSSTSAALKPSATPAAETLADSSSSAAAAKEGDKQHISTKEPLATPAVSSNPVENDGDGLHFTREYLEQEVLEKVERCTVAELLKLLSSELKVVVPKNNKSKYPRKEVLISMVRERVAELVSKMESGITGQTTSKPSEASETSMETAAAAAAETPVVENGGGSEEKSVLSNGEKMEKEEETTVAAEEAAEKTSSSANKRKLEEDSAAEKTITQENLSTESSKKLKTSSEEEVVKKVVFTSEDPSSNSSKNPHSGVTSSLKVKGVGLSVVSLAALLSPHKHDQFELCVVAELLGDALTIHFARFIHSAVLANFHLITSSGGAKAKLAAEPVEKRSIEVNYVHLAFSYFDRAHCGLMPCEDLQALLNATGLPLSRKVYSALVSACESNEKAIAYREFAEPQGPLVERPPVYPTVHHLQSGGADTGDSTGFSLTGDGPSKSAVPLMVERNGVQYNVDQLIRQAVEDQKVKVELSEQLLKVTAKSALFEKSMAELESKQRLMSSAAAKKNDELCAVKRARDQLLAKYEGLRKSVATVNSTLTATMQKYPTAKGGGKALEAQQSQETTAPAPAPSTEH